MISIGYRQLGPGCLSSRDFIYSFLIDLDGSHSGCCGTLTCCPAGSCLGRGCRLSAFHLCSLFRCILGIASSCSLVAWRGDGLLNSLLARLARFVPVPWDQVSARLFTFEAQKFSDLFVLINLHLKHEMPRDCIYQILPRQQRLVFGAHA